MAEIKVATDANFEELVLKSERPVVVDFWAAWCGPCKMVAPEMEKLADKYDGAVDVVKVDVDANPGLSQAFNILSIPVIAFFKPGAQPQGVVGFRPLEQLEQTFNLAEFTPVDSRLTSAQARLTPHPRSATPVTDRGRSIPGSAASVARPSAAMSRGEPGDRPVRRVVVELGRREDDPARPARRRRVRPASGRRQRRRPGRARTRPSSPVGRADGERSAAARPGRPRRPAPSVVSTSASVRRRPSSSSRRSSRAAAARIAVEVARGAPRSARSSRRGRTRWCVGVLEPAGLGHDRQVAAQLAGHASGTARAPRPSAARAHARVDLGVDDLAAARVPVGVRRAPSPGWSR